MSMPGMLLYNIFFGGGGMGMEGGGKKQDKIELLTKKNDEKYTIQFNIYI